MASEWLIVEQLEYIGVAEKLCGHGYQQIGREYSHVGGVRATVAVKYPYGQG